MKWLPWQVRLRRLVNLAPLQDDQKVHMLTFLMGGLGELAAVAFHWLLESAQLAVGALLRSYAPEARGAASRR